mmetsp:Transcript_2257/g.3048  ORF Transcript_2257/g.3048 Transcript_2257/m.3048 type:complete len:349 (+) Transcript_2257:129-1175(+)
MSYDKEESCLYTGDEAGHLRKWNLSHVLKHLNLIKLPTNSNHRIGHGNHHSQHQKTKQALHIESLSTLKGRQYSSSLVEFRWGQEVAHEADITTVSITYEPKTILTTSTDCCVKMFSYGGKSLGRLVQSVKTGLQSSCWDIPLNVEKRIENENLEIQSIMDEADKIEALEAEQKAYDENNRYHRHHKGGGGGGGNSIGDGSSIHRNNRRTRKTGSRGTQNSEAIEKEKMHKKVLSVLANVKTSTSQSKPVAVSSSSETVGNLKFREKTRRLPPSLKLTDPTSRPPIVLSGLGPGLDQAQLSNGMNLNGHLPQISVSNSHVQLKKETDVGDDILASMARLNAQLDILED